MGANLSCHKNVQQPATKQTMRRVPTATATGNSNTNNSSNIYGSNSNGRIQQLCKQIAVALYFYFTSANARAYYSFFLFFVLCLS